ncbi:oxygenase MpaB family protein [Gordonia aurantiaca]|uniref:oxygenase MpaB family protein n=1 Tax=Gordonia sp. B21 TaxID=3151852 RepID=UPI0032639834
MTLTDQTGSVDATTPEQATSAVDLTDLPPAVEQFRWHLGSLLFGFFVASFFDQVALAPVAAAVDRTGRFADNFVDRGLRSFGAEQLVLWGDDRTRDEFADRLKYLHREVRGTGHGAFAGTRYSALDPTLWNWIAMSAMMGYLHSFTPCTGIELTPDEEELAYALMLERFGVLQLPGKSYQLPATLADARRWYDEVVAERVQPNSFLDEVTEGLTRLPLPTIGLPPVVRTVLTPIWMLVRPLAGHVVKVCSFSILHPGVRAATTVRLGRREQWEFRLYQRLLQAAWRHLPRRIILTPMAYHQYRRERLARSYRSMQLDSFAAECPASERRCPATP